MTRSHLSSMESEKTSKGDNNENYLTANTRETTTINENKVNEKGEENPNDVITKKGMKRQKDRPKGGDNQIPVVTVENPTPSPHPPSRGPKDKEGRDEEEEEDDDDEMDYESGEEEEVEEEEEETEMTQEEKLAMYTCVKEGDIDALEDCLDLPNSDINMTWFQENLLMAAIRAGQTEMAEFLVDNGVDHTFTTSRMAVREKPEGGMKFDCYQIDCRQMAFEKDLDELVYLIDHLQGRLFSFVPGPKRSPRLRRPPPPTPTDSNSEGGNSSDADISDSSQESFDGDGNEKSAADQTDTDTMKKKRKKKRAKKKNENVEKSEGEEDGEKDKTARTGSTFGEVDSGNYSMNSSNKLKKSFVEKHNELLEQDEISTADKNIKSPRRSVSLADSQKSQIKSQRENDENDNEVDDETGSPRSTTAQSVSPEKTPQWVESFHPPPLPIRFTRSSLAIKQSNALRRFYTSPLNDSNTDTPLQWRKVQTAGSYVVESKNWHWDNNRSISTDTEPSVSVEALTPTKSKIPSASTTSGKFTLLPTVSVSSSTPPRTNSSSSSSKSSSPRSSMSRMSSTSTKPTSILKSSSSSDRSTQRVPDPSKQERPVAGYMRHTKSTITKQRLSSSFVDSYGGLDFHHSQIFKTPSPKPDRLVHGAKPIPISPVLPVSYKTPKTKSDLQRRNQNAISFRA